MPANGDWSLCFLRHARGPRARPDHRCGDENDLRRVRHRGIVVNAKKIRRLMREHALNPRQRRRFIATTDSDHNYPIFPNRRNLLQAQIIIESWRRHQHDQAARIAWIQAASTGFVSAFAAWPAALRRTGSAGPAGATASLKLTFHLDHSAGTHQSGGAIGRNWP